MTTNILGIAGSLRRESFNRTLLTAAGAHLPDHIELHHWDRLADIPPFDEDREHPVPAAVAELRDAIANADALLIATPEYNGSIPGQLKNAIDWASRPRGDSSLGGKPAAVIGASPTPHGATWAQEDLRRVLGIAGADVAGRHLPVPHVFRQFDENGSLLDADLRADLRTLIAQLDLRVRASATAA